MKHEANKHDPSTYDPEVHGRCQVHIGLTMPDIQSLILFLEDEPLHRDKPVYVDGGGWNAWGDPVGEGTNDDETYVVSIPVQSPRRGQQLIADLLDFQFGYERLVPIANQVKWPEDTVPVIAVVTDGLDHSHYQHNLSWEGFTEGGTPSGVYFSMWPKGRKAYTIEIGDDDAADLENWLFSRSAEITHTRPVESGIPAQRQ